MLAVAQATTPWWITLLIGLVTALVGGFCVYLLNRRGTSQESKRERSGLLRLIKLEMDHNWQYISDWDPGHRERVRDIVRRVDAGDFWTEKWDKSNAKLSQLLPDDDFDAIVRLYDLLKDLKLKVRQLRRNDESNDEAQSDKDRSEWNDSQSEISIPVSDLKDRYRRADEVIKKYL